MTMTPISDSYTPYMTASRLNAPVILLNETVSRLCCQHRPREIFFNLSLIFSDNMKEFSIMAKTKRKMGISWPFRFLWHTSNVLQLSQIADKATYHPCTVQAGMGSKAQKTLLNTSYGFPSVNLLFSPVWLRGEILVSFKPATVLQTCSRKTTFLEKRSLLFL